MFVWTVGVRVVKGNQPNFKTKLIKETTTEKMFEGCGVGDGLIIRNKLSFQDKAV